MSDIVYATGSHYYAADSDTWYAGEAVLGSDMKGAYKFPSLAAYKEAASIKLTLYRKSGSGTLKLYNQSSLTAISKGSLGSVSVASSAATVTADLSSYISSLTNKDAVWYLVLEGSTMTFERYSTSGKKAYLEIETASGGLVYFCTGGVYKPCEAYFGSGGKWVQCEARFGNGGSWKELGK